MELPHNSMSHRYHMLLIFCVATIFILYCRFSFKYSVNICKKYIISVFFLKLYTTKIKNASIFLENNTREIQQKSFTDTFMRRKFNLSIKLY